MEAKRLARYKAKLELLEERLSDIDEWLSGLSYEAFRGDKKTFLAVYKAFQEAVESASDLNAMMASDSKLIVQDDYTNVDKLVSSKLISKETADSLKEATGLRNRLVHEYNGIESKTAFESIKALIPKLTAFSVEVKEWLKSKK